MSDKRIGSQPVSPLAQVFREKGGTLVQAGHLIGLATMEISSAKSAVAQIKRAKERKKGKERKREKKREIEREREVSIWLINWSSWQLAVGFLVNRPTAVSH